MNIAEEVGRFVLCVVALFAAGLALIGLSNMMGHPEDPDVWGNFAFALVLGIPLYLVLLWRRRRKLNA